MSRTSRRKVGSFCLLFWSSTLSCGSLDDVDMARMAKLSNQEPQFIEPPVSVALIQGQTHCPSSLFLPPEMLSLGLPRPSDLEGTPEKCHHIRLIGRGIREGWSVHYVSTFVLHLGAE